MTTASDLPRPLVVVGVDGSPSSHEALRWAAHYVSVAGGTLQAVISWHYPVDYGYAAVPNADMDLAGWAREAVETAIAEVHDEFPDVVITPRVLEGPPAFVLVEAAEGADLIVVGSRGHGGFAGVLLGSVSTHVVHHAHCPVVVVRQPPAA
jgi:nucleotide-binding universal stress UspA family protein